MEEIEIWRPDKTAPMQFKELRCYPGDIIQSANSGAGSSTLKLIFRKFSDGYPQFAHLYDATSHADLPQNKANTLLTLIEQDRGLAPFWPCIGYLCREIFWQGRHQNLQLAAHYFQPGPGESVTDGVYFSYAINESVMPFDPTYAQNCQFRAVESLLSVLASRDRDRLGLIGNALEKHRDGYQCVSRRSNTASCNIEQALDDFGQQVQSFSKQRRRELESLQTAVGELEEDEGRPWEVMWKEDLEQLNEELPTWRDRST